MPTPLDTEHWELHAYIDWRPKKKDEYTTCTHCGGSGKVGGHFKSLDDPSDCPECFGAGTHWVMPDRGPKPTIPPELTAHLRAAWEAYFKESQK